MLYIHFFVSAPFGVAVGLDRATPGLMKLRPRPSTETFDNPQMNWTAAELALAVMITQMDLFNRLLKTSPLTAPQFGLAVAAAVLLLGLWEGGKLVARRQGH